jgi:hypothetical protein
MNKFLAVLLGIFGLLFVAAVIAGFTIYGYFSKEVRLRNEFVKQQEVNVVIYDNVWKTIAQEAEIKETYKDEFKEVWEVISKGNSANSAGALSVFINRHNPKFDSRITLKLMNTIEGSRKEFTNNQVKLIDIKREHDDLRKSPLSGLFVGSKPELELKLVTSDKTDDAFKTGKENDVSLKKDKKDKK